MTSEVKCAPSKNLNSAYPQFATAKEMYAHLREITQPVGLSRVNSFRKKSLAVVARAVLHNPPCLQGGEFVVRNFVGVIQDISPQASLVETPLFPAGALHYYTKKNMGWEYTQEEYDTWQLAERGGEQGDYRDGMPEKIANVIDCLRTEPLSKRAVIPIPYSNVGSATIDWKDRGQNKCCRELHFYLEDGKLKCTGK